MHLTRLSVQGFRSLKDVTWEPGKLNVVIGPNGSGKSNLLKLLDLVRHATKGNLQDFIQASGGAEAISWDGQRQEIGLGFQLCDLTKDELRFSEYDFSIGFVDSDFSAVLKEVLVSPCMNFTSAWREPVHFFYEDRSVKTWSKDTSIETVLSQDRGHYVLDYPMLEISRYFLSFWASNVIDTSPDSKIRSSVVARYEKAVGTDGQNLINVLHTLYTESREFKKAVNEAMRAAFGDDFEELVFPPASDQRVQMRVRWRSLKREQSAADMSDGTLRFLFLLAVLANPEPAPLIAIDEPETGLHPSMMPLIAELAVEASKKTQVIFTTHSDQFLDAFHDTRPTTTVAKWEEGQTKLHIVDDDELKHFLKDYSLGALFRSGELESDFLARRQDAA